MERDVSEQGMVCAKASVRDYGFILLYTTNES